MWLANVITTKDSLPTELCLITVHSNIENWTKLSFFIFFPTLSRINRALFTIHKNMYTQKGQVPQDFIAPGAISTHS